MTSFTSLGARALALATVLIVASFIDEAWAQKGPGVELSPVQRLEAMRTRAAVRRDSVRALMERLKEGERRRVIVSLDLDGGGVDAEELRRIPRRQRRELRRQHIARVQAQFLGHLVGQRIKRIFAPQRLPVVVLEVDESALERMMNADEVSMVVEDRLSAPTLLDSRVQIGADIASLDGYRGQGQAVAILDSGVDGQHAAFAGRIVAPACFSNNSSASSSLCPGGVETSYSVTAGEECVGISACDHGTHVAGIAAGDHATHKGVAPQAAIIPVQVFSRFDTTEYCGSPPCILSWSSDQIRALNYVLGLVEDESFPYQVASVNMSLGGGGASTIAACDSSNTGVRLAVEWLLDAGVATVISAGNAGRSVVIGEPGCISSAVSVGSVDGGANGGFDISGYSDRASWLDILSPGAGIIAPVPGGGLGGKSGTSMAAPHVAGAVAVLRSKAPEASIAQVLAALGNSDVIIADVATGFRYPRLQLDTALDLMEPGSPRPFSLVLDQVNSGTIVSGSFGLSTQTDAYGGDTRISTDVGVSIYRFVPDLPVSGVYRLYGWWPEDGNLTGPAEYRVAETDGVASILVDQGVDDGHWVVLGEFDLQAGEGSYVDIVASDGAVVAADAIKIELKNVLPDIQFQAPVSGVTVLQGTLVPVEVSATDVDGSVAQVELFVDGLSQGVDLEAPFSFSWDALTPGSRVLEAVASDNDGDTSREVISVQVVSPPLAVVTSELPDAIQGEAYLANLVASGGSGSYQWSIPSGSLPEGLTLQSAGNILGTPEVVGLYEFELQVSDGSSVAAASLTLTVNDGEPAEEVLLLDEQFDAPVFSGWTVVDEGDLSAPSSWALTGGQAVQSSNINSRDVGLLAKLGTYLSYDNGGGWTDYRATVRFRSGDNDALGVMFRVESALDYYRFSWDRQSGVRRLVKNEGGVFSLLAEDAVVYTTGQTYEVELKAEGSLLEVRVDGTLVFSVMDTAHTQGTVALYTWANAPSYFESVQVNGASQTTPNVPPEITEVSATPLVLTDIETSQLTVTATDMDGPSPLSYSWEISQGAGELDDINSRTPVFTPADVSSQSTVVLTVTVSDGSSVAAASLTLTVNDGEPAEEVLLLDEQFDGPVFSGWTVVDEGDLSAPSSWALTGGQAVQSSNINSRNVDLLAKLGTYLSYDNGGGWTDYRATVRFRSGDNDALGVMFRVESALDYYRFSWDRQSGVRRLAKNEGGVFSLLAEDAVVYTTGQTYEVELKAEGSLLEVRVDGALVFSVMDTAHTQGTVALYTWANAPSYFESVQVNGASQTTPNVPPEITEVSATPLVLTDTETSQLTVTATDMDGPSPLSYSWEISQGAGELDDINSRTPVFTPADVSSQSAVVLTVTVSDGSSVAAASLTLTVNDGEPAEEVLLLDEQFDGPVFSGWTVVDEGDLSAPSSWALTGGQAVQSSNINSRDVDLLAKLGTYLSYDNGGGWTDYRATVRFRSGDNDALGVMFRAESALDYYRFSWDWQSGVRRLAKNEGGVFSLLAEDAVVYTTGQTYEVELKAEGSLLEVRVDGALVFSVMDTAHTQGTVALYTWANAPSYFESVRVVE